MNSRNASTPYLQIDWSRVERNVRRLASYAAEHGLAVRPHTKTHKSRRLAQLQLEAGAAGLTVAKVGEAEVLASEQSGLDLLLAYPPVDESRAERVATLAQDHTLRVAADTTAGIEALTRAVARAGVTVGVLVDLDVGLGRTGVPTPQRAAELAMEIDRRPGLRVDGLFCYPGQVWDPANDQAAALSRIAAKLAETLDLFKQRGLSTSIVSGGSTPTAYQSHLLPQVTEVRPGTYVFNDYNTLRGGYCQLDDCAAVVVSTVISDAVSGQVVIDAGSKTLTSDRCAPAPDAGHGLILEYPDATITKLTEEHGQVDVHACDRRPRVGERVTILPNHICPCVNLHDVMWVGDGDGSLEPMPVDARGRLS